MHRNGLTPPITAACRLQPALSPDGTAAVFDSSHNGLGWQIYEAALPEPGSAGSADSSSSSSAAALASDGAVLGSDLGETRMEAAAAGQQQQQQQHLLRGPYQPRQLYVDLGSQEGSSVLQFLQRRGWQGRFEVRRSSLNRGLPAGVGW